MRESKSKSENTEVREGTEPELPRVLGLNRLTELIIGAAIEVHRNTGPGLMESVYEECLCYELNQLGLKFRSQVELPVSYKQIKLNCGFRMDIVVEEAVVLELKTVDQLLPIHSAQLLTYLKLSGKKIGLLINFNETQLRKGLKRLANVTLSPSELLPSVFSPTSVFSNLAFLTSLCLCASVVKSVRPNYSSQLSDLVPSVFSPTSVFSNLAFLTSLCLCVSVVNRFDFFRLSPVNN
jgi:GxxExxY protein